MKNLQAVARLILQSVPSLPLTILEVGARPVGENEPFHRLLEALPGSRVIAIEVDSALCAELNRQARPSLRYYPHALGRTEETRPFYEAMHPMCSSLYEPDHAVLDRYHGLEVARLKSVGTIETVSLDTFSRRHELGPIDFIKIDIQGAELDVFAGGTATLAGTLGIVTEVEFVPLYKQQPLFGDVCRFLAEHALPFHRFLGMCGRTLRPVLINNDPNAMTQHLWADALFLRDLSRIDQFAPEQLLKLAVFSNLYQSADVAVCCLLEYDRRTGTNLAAGYMGL